MLTPSKIKNHHFEAAGKNAYRAQSVDDFFEIVADSYEQMFKENGELVKKIGLLAERVEEYRNDEDNIRAALLTAQRMADQIMRETNEKSEAQLAEAASSAKKQEEEAALKAKNLLDKAQSKADLLIAETQQKAQQMIEDATAEAKEQAVIARDRMIKTQAALDLIEKEADKFKRELLALYTEHIELINKIPETQDEPEDEQPVEAEEPKEEVKAEEPAAEVAAEPEEAAEPAPEITEPEESEPVIEPKEEQAEEETTYSAPKAQPEEAASENVIEEPEEELSDSDFERLGLKTPEVSEEKNDEDKETEDFKNKFRDAFADMREQVKKPEDDAEDIKTEEPASDNDGFKFDINSLNFNDDDESDDEEYFDDEDDDDDFYDDDDEDDDDEDDGFSSKLKGFFKR